MDQESKRLSEFSHGIRPWKKWGPYLSERQWGTVREDYSHGGNAWGYMTHDMARSKAYRWGEEGIAGISDFRQRICFALSFWNHQDSQLKERLFGLTGPQGNHGEDVKEYYYYLDNTPTHAYMKMLYKYPQAAFPYEQLYRENAQRGRNVPEFELIDTGIFAEDKYFDIEVEYAKAAEEDLLIQVTIHNRGPEKAKLDVMPTIWFRNTWEWGEDDYKPHLKAAGKGAIDLSHRDFAPFSFYADQPKAWLFCENETNRRRIYGENEADKVLKRSSSISNEGIYKDGINDFVVHGREDALSKHKKGTKAAAHYQLTLKPGEKKVIQLRLGPTDNPDPFAGFEYMFSQRKKEADSFYEGLHKDVQSPDAQAIQRQAYAGMLWSKQFYFYDVPKWLNGDPVYPPPPPSRHHGRNSDWPHLHNADIISMPDKWEYPWYAAWDLAFHCIPLAALDADFAKEQLLLLTKEWYMHPNGQLPAYEWNFSDVNPPVHAWASWRVYQIEKKKAGKGDRDFLEQIFHKLLLNFTWWVNRKDTEGNNIFQGGFLGLDNIGVFDRSAKLPTGGHIEQADATSWMAMYSLNLLRIALELAKENPTYQHMAIKFFEHFLYIAAAMTHVGGEEINLWDDEDEFFYDVLKLPNGKKHRLKVRSMVGLIPLFAVEVLEQELLDEMPEFTAHMEWFLNHRPELANLVSRWQESGQKGLHLLSMCRQHRMSKLLSRMLDETEFLSDYGIRALSRHHLEHPYEVQFGGTKFSVQYLPSESDSDFFGGNSNWRGPVWFPVNYLLIESLYKYHSYYGDKWQIEYPSGSGKTYSLREIANDLSKRLARLFLRDDSGKRPIYGSIAKFQDDPHFKDLLLFYEYFHGDSGLGLGASHQTGWTGLVATLLHEYGAEDSLNA